MSDPYGNYPAAPPPVQPQATPRGEPPSTVRTAVTLMFVRVAVSIVGIVLLVATKDDLRKRIQDANPGYDSSKLDSVVNAGLGVGVAFAVVVLVLYVILAFQVRKGKNWARIVTWVFAGLGVLGVLSVLSSTSTPAQQVATVVEGVIDLVIIVLLALGTSNGYFRRR